MMYFANPTANPATHEMMRKGILGFIDTPGQGYRHVRQPGMRWCADNGCFNDKRFSEDRWWKFLEDNAHASEDCVFATAPDVVGDHHATLKRSRLWLEKIRSLGYPVAFVAQDGSTPENMPWGEFDVLFIGGTNDFKLGEAARKVIRAGQERSLWVHVGRVNSKRRYSLFASLGCDSCDGTYLTFGPDINLPKLLSWIEDSSATPELFDMKELC